MIYKILYQLARIYAHLSLYLFFDKVEVIGKNKIPRNVPLIFAPNHQNAFLDGVIVTCLSGVVSSFLARADVFNVPILKPILKFSRIIPVYRLRDGAGNMSKNYDTFRDVSEHLSKNKSILIFPEGNQIFTRHLRPLKKGLFRIIESCMELNCAPQVVPVGINYENHTKSGFNLIVSFGDTITFNAPLSSGFVHEKEHLFKSIKPLMQNIDDYDMQILSESGWLMETNFDHSTIQNESEWLGKTQFSDSFLNKVAEWRHLSFQRGLLPWYGRLKTRDFLLFLPLFIMYIIMTPIKALNKYISQRIGKHRAFKLSIVYALALIELPVYFLLLIGMVHFYLPSIYLLIFLILILIYVLFKRTLEKYAFHFKKFRWKKNQRDEWERSETLALEIRKDLIGDYQFSL